MIPTQASTPLDLKALITQVLSQGDKRKKEPVPDDREALSSLEKRRLLESALSDDRLDALRFRFLAEKKLFQGLALPELRKELDRRISQ